MFLRIYKLFAILILLYAMNKWFIFSKIFQLKHKKSFHFLLFKNKHNYSIKKNFFLIKKKFSKYKNYAENDTIFKYTKYDKNDDFYIEILEKKANEIKNTKNSFNNKIKKIKNEGWYQPLDYTTLYLLSFELNVLLQDSFVEHITQVDDKTIVLHLNKNEKEYYLYLCYDKNNPVISLGLKIKKLFNRFIDDDYAQKLNPVLKYSVISNIYMKKSFIKILCIDFILKRKCEEDIDIEDILCNSEGNRKVTLLFDLHHNSCISFVINKSTNEILVSPYNYITEKTIDKSFKEGHIYIFPEKNECKIIPNHYEFFSSFLNNFKSRKDQNLISSLMDIYEGLSFNVLLKFFDYLNIPSDLTFSQIDQSLLLDFFNKAYIKWLRFLNLKEKNNNFIFCPHYDYKLNTHSPLKFIKTKNYIIPVVPEKNSQEDDIPNNSLMVKYDGMNKIENNEINQKNKDILKEDLNTKTLKNEHNQIKTNDDNKINDKEIQFETVIEMVYYYYASVFSVNNFYTTLKYCKDFIRKKLPLYDEMLNQYKNDKEVCEKMYLLRENIDKLSVFNHTISKMDEWIDKKTFDALKLIENELKFNALEDNRKKYVKKLHEKKQKEEILQKKILNVKPNNIKTPQNIYKGSLLIKINETDLSSPFLIIGRNSKQNEKISTQILKFNDLWFHVHEHPGGHVILRNKKINDKIITADINLSDIKIDDDLKYAANMAAYFSKARKMEKTLVCFTLGKYVLKDNTLSEGAVEVLKYKLIYGRPGKVASIIKDLNERNKEIELSKKKK
ncbi:FbpA domain protein, putative [Plasmodium gallinaceum]|uniref:FbpA domain protein, putative n=1 Tax=Plasmodium gallinaceum TaxID=5849 RepID=A0A1J1GYZ6_PLAGA|nr:FbpA domain protein, putative [Plasmodium gallinaceum]CRG97780.1 FbpA domain protein, putative [Plasmodium gallinaceum]